MLTPIIVIITTHYNLKTPDQKGYQRQGESLQGIRAGQALFQELLSWTPSETKRNAGVSRSWWSKKKKKETTLPHCVDSFW